MSMYCGPTAFTQENHLNTRMSRTGQYLTGTTLRPESSTPSLSSSSSPASSASRSHPKRRTMARLSQSPLNILLPCLYVVNRNIALMSLSLPSSMAFLPSSHRVSSDVCACVSSSASRGRNMMLDVLLLSSSPLHSSSNRRRIKSHLFASPRPPGPQPQTSSRSSNNFFFAEDWNDQTDSPNSNMRSTNKYDESKTDAKTNSARSSGGMEAYVAQMAAMTRSPGKNNNSEMPTGPSQTQNESSLTSEPSSSSPPPPPATSTNPKPTPQKPISSVDARVLESILREGKLDLSTEEQVKKLLEGPRMRDDDNVKGVSKGSSDRDKGAEYNSKFVSTISDNTFWNSLKAKAASILDSIQIYIENRIERDTQLLASVGLFAWDRIQRDVARALPAAGRQVKRALLASNSSYVEKLLNVTEKVGVLSLPSERSVTKREMEMDSLSVYEELTTPADEIKQVTEAIRDILSGKGSPLSSSASNRRAVRSLAPAGTSRLAERQQRAYLARKKTVLQREKEGLDRTFGRAIGSVSDATWELRREMEMGEGREAGYRSKGVRKALAAGAVRLLEAGRAGGRWLSGGRTKMIGEAENRGARDTAGSASIVDVTAYLEEEEMIAEVIEERKLEYAQDGLLSPQSFIEEKRRLITSLESCLSEPGETWLTKEVVAQATMSGISLDGIILREVITTMVCARDELRKGLKDEEDGECATLKIDYIQKELRRMKQIVDSVSSLAVAAAGEAAASLLKQELEGFVLSDSLDDIIEIELERMEQMLAELVAEREEEIERRKTSKNVVVEPERIVDPMATTMVDAVTVDQARSVERNRFVEASATDVEVIIKSDTYAMAPSDERTNVQQTVTQRSSDQDAELQLPRSMVEVVSDQEYSGYEQSFKSAQSSVMDERADADSKNDNSVGKFVLRVIDAIFFVGEKLFLVALPAVIKSGSNISSRYAQAQNRGNGSVGWRLLKNVNTRKNLY